MPADRAEVSDHQHVYQVKGSGSSCWAECVLVVKVGVGMYTVCGHKLNRGNGVVVGSHKTVEKATTA
jgi:hypothetical protein